ncbi:MAG: peptidase T [Thermoguttaceae bacterium]
MNTRRLLQRFLRYVKIDTTARTDAKSYPSSPGQLRLGRLLVRELKAMGIEDARQDKFGIVLATVPATVVEPAATIAFCSHMDTSPETTGKGVKPQVIRKYCGGDIVLPASQQQVIQVSENPELEKAIGHTLITTDGTTLLGADDKAGLAIIMEAAAWLMEHREIVHGPIRLCFTCDEEVGRGVQHVEVGQIGAVACYTVDGHGSDEIDVETFSAETADVTLRGVNIHPSIAKGRMTNALRVAADFLARLPRDRLAPEATDGREGFIHPIEISGGVGSVKIRLLLRDFETTRLVDLAQVLRQAADATVGEFPEAGFDMDVTRTYLNMADGLVREPRAVVYAEEALARLGRTARKTIVRGGTDGSRLTELGLPAPNLSSGAHSIHSTKEWASLEEMTYSVQWLVSLAETWATGKDVHNL